MASAGIAAYASRPRANRRCGYPASAGLLRRQRLDERQAALDPWLELALRLDALGRDEDPALGPAPGAHLHLHRVLATERLGGLGGVHAHEQAAGARGGDGHVAVQQ